MTTILQHRSASAAALLRHALMKRGGATKATRTTTAMTTCFRRHLSAPAASYDEMTPQSSHKPFPSLILGAHKSITAVGSFAEAQASFLEPDHDSVSELAKLLDITNTGIVAHYYMDVELQGVLQAVGQRHLPGRVGIADSLRMGDMAVEMVEKHNVQNVICLGVDFMSESVQAILHRNNHENIPVYRATPAKIGCSLAESAEHENYRAWLQQEGAAAHNNALHVVYINTSLETKAVSNSIVPTITCTSSNVLFTLLQASAQMPDVKILYGPDTYMGENLVTLLSTLVDHWTDEQIQNKLHPAHNLSTLQRLRDKIAVFPQGNCVVHHMFGADIVDTVHKSYPDVYVTAHLEVPGEMFEIANAKSLNDQGVVGSTSDILNFITRKVQHAAEAENRTDERLSFILGTEAGMVTSIVQNVQNILETNNAENLEAEIIFPVASEAVMATEGDDILPVVPGAGGGEGCSTAGGCATCPYMKMNSLDNLLQVLDDQQTGNQEILKAHLPPNRLQGKSIQGRPATDWGSEPIVYMRSLNQHKKIPDDLVQRIQHQKY